MQKAMGAFDIAALQSERISWQVAHEALSRLARARAAADAEEGRWLLAAQRAAVHVHLGYASFAEYIERLFGYKPRSSQEKLRVAEALEGLPALAHALSSGELSWSAVRELTRVAVGDTEHEWLEFARGKTVRQLEQVLARKQLGDTPSSPPDPSAQRHVLRFEVAADTFALFRDALNELRHRAGVALDEDSALLEMARSVLGGPRDEGRASYQVVLSVCPQCGSGQQHANGGLVPVDPDVIRMARCDCQQIGSIVEHSPRPANDLQPHVQAPGSRLQAPGLRPQSRAEGEGTLEETSAAEDKTAHMGASTAMNATVIEHQTAHANAPIAVDEGAAAERKTARGTRRSNRLVPPGGASVSPRAQQTIPPALRRAVLLRDQRRCQVPGCNNTTWRDLHHLELRSEGGRHSLDNVICICGSHHRAAHRGVILLDRSEGGALRVRHADGTEYGRGVKPQTMELRAKVFSALRHLGFREGEVRAALEQLQREPAGEQISFDGLLRAALDRLRPSGARR
jgi:hypothetical protein